MYSLLHGIPRDMRACNPTYPDFPDMRDPDFSDFTTTLDNLFKSLQLRGIGSLTNATEGLTLEEEEQLWLSGSLNVDSPKGLLYAVFFFVAANAFACVVVKSIMTLNCLSLNDATSLTIISIMNILQEQAR